MDTIKFGCGTLTTALVCGFFLLALPLQAWTIEINAQAPAVNLPMLKATDATKESLALSSFRGKVVYVDFWASWCGPCRKSLPLLNTLRNRYNDQFEVFAINLDEDIADAHKFLTKYPVDYPVVRDASGSTPEAFGLMGMPTGYLLDQRGLVKVVHAGFRKKDIVKIEAEIQALIKNVKPQ